MEDLLTYIMMGSLVLLTVFQWIIYRKFHVFKFIVLILIGALFLGIKFYPEWFTFISITQLKTYFIYGLFLVSLMYAITFKRKIKITRNLTDYDFFELEKELSETKTQSDLLRLRYISTIGLVNEALIFYNEGLDGLFVTEQFQMISKQEKSEYTFEEYVAMIHEDDRSQYMSTVKKANHKSPLYDIKYRIISEGFSIWVEEKGKWFRFEKQDHLISAIKPIDIKLFPETLIHEIDSLPNEQNLVQYVSAALKETEPFYLIMIQLTNIPDINARFGRDVGNLMIAEYIKKMRYHFAKDINSIFRVTGIQFALIIKEQRKYEVLYRALQSGGELINLMLNIGGIQQVVYPNLGIVKHEPWSTYTLNELISLSNKALQEAIHNTKKNYSVFGE
ncbi:MAG: diguanylate cyclase [Candidatus Izemoplasmatales bacterium]|nr:diguanylate cyclase [Candidatus Izemoplasmatales bacterium]